jgi:hypothetical protein
MARHAPELVAGMDRNTHSGGKNAVAIHLAVEQQSLYRLLDPHYWPFDPPVADAREQRFESDEQALVAPYARSKPRACRMAKWRARYIVHDPSAGGVSRR